MNLPTFDELMNTVEQYNLQLAPHSYFDPTDRSVCAIGLISFHLDGEDATIKRMETVVREDIAIKHNIPLGDLEAVEYAFENLSYLGKIYEGSLAHNLGKRLRAERSV